MHEWVNLSLSKSLLCVLQSPVDFTSSSITIDLKGKVKTAGLPRFRLLYPLTYIYIAHALQSTYLCTALTDELGKTNFEVFSSGAVQK